jgi:hypothetical protein
MTSVPDESVGTRYLNDEVQRFGWASAATVIDRYSTLVDRATGEGSSTSAPDFDPGVLVDAAVRMAAGYLRLLDTTATLVVSRRARTSGPERVVMPAARPGEGSEIALWLHNPTASPVTGIELGATGMVSPDGGAIPTGALSVIPPRIDRLDGSSSRELLLRVDIPEDQQAGIYFGLVELTGLPGDPITVQMEVKAATPEGHRS